MKMKLYTCMVLFGFCAASNIWQSHLVNSNSGICCCCCPPLLLLFPSTPTIVVVVVGVVVAILDGLVC